MKMKSSELTGHALDWAVAKCEGEQVYLPHLDRICADAGESEFYRPSTDWSQGGPIIEREQLLIQPEIGKEGAGNAWSAISMQGFECLGPTPLVAAMRCYVASKLGDEVEIPAELTQGEAE